MAREKEIGLLTNNEALKKRVIEVCERYGFEYTHWDNLDTFGECKDGYKVIVASLDTPEGGQVSAPELAQVVRFSMANPFLICVIADSMPKDDAVFAKRSGANLVLLQDELLNTAKFDFIVTQVIQASFLPIKVSDIKPGVAVGFDVYHLLPQRQKFLKMIFEGDVPDEEKMQKAVGVNELYIHRDHAVAFKTYVEAHTDLSAAGIDKRCRSQFLALSAEFSRMVFQLTNLAEHSSFGEGQELLKQCSTLCKELMGTLAAAGEAWDVVNKSAIGTFGTVDRAPAIAAYAGLFGLRMGWESVDETMLVALLSDLGLLLLPAATLLKVKGGQDSSLSELEREAFHHYPSQSLSLVLNRKLSLGEKQRKWISSTRERMDGKGFPAKIEGDKFQREARLVAFCREFDHRTLLNLGQVRVPPEKILEEMIRNDKDWEARIGAALLGELDRALLKQDSGETKA
jgi:HD-GYP domain-containing protein (c-di-GMP phosphodiesterase class II)